MQEYILLYFTSFLYVVSTIMSNVFMSNHIVIIHLNVTIESARPVGKTRRLPFPVGLLPFFSSRDTSSQRPFEWVQLYNILNAAGRWPRTRSAVRSLRLSSISERIPTAFSFFSPIFYNKNENEKTGELKENGSR